MRQLLVAVKGHPGSASAASAARRLAHFRLCVGSRCCRRLTSGGTRRDRTASGRDRTENRDDLRRAFDEAGLAPRLHAPEHGTWVPLRP
jgi:hypothetical protein